MQKIPNFNLKLYAFVYNSLIDFAASSDVTFDITTTNNFLKNVHKIIKVYLHHSLVTGKSFGYAHNFCNWRIRENKSEIPVIVHNLLGFDMFFFFFEKLSSHCLVYKGDKVRRFKFDEHKFHQH